MTTTYVDVDDDEYYAEAVDEFCFQVRRFGYYDSEDDATWLRNRPAIDPATIVAERRWLPASKTTIPSRLWDASLPQCAAF